MDKEVKSFIRQLASQGWHSPKTTGSGHVRLEYALGGHIIFPSTPSDRRWLHNKWTEIEKIYKEVGRYTAPIKEDRSSRIGLDYVKPEPVVPSKQLLATTTIQPQQPKEEQIAMSGSTTTLIIELLHVRRNEIMEKLKPHAALLKDLEEVNALLAQFGKGSSPVAPKSENEKIKAFMDKKNSSSPAKKARIRHVSPEETCRYAEETVKANGGVMDLQELANWMEEVHGLQRSGSRTVRQKIVDDIKKYNERNPNWQRLELVKVSDTTDPLKIRYVSVRTLSK